MKKVIIILIVLLTLSLIPISSKMRDGGTTRYAAILYTVYDVHRVIDTGEGNEDGVYESEYSERIVIKILGFEVFNNTNPHIVV